MLHRGAVVIRVNLANAHARSACNEPRTFKAMIISGTMRLFVLAVCLAVVVGDHGTDTGGDAFCLTLNIILNPVIQNCQELMQASHLSTQTLAGLV